MDKKTEYDNEATDVIISDHMNNHIEIANRR